MFNSEKIPIQENPCNAHSTRPAVNCLLPRSEIGNPNFNPEHQALNSEPRTLNLQEPRTPNSKNQAFHKLLLYLVVLVAVLGICSAGLANSDDLNVEVRPEQPVVGQSSTLVISSNKTTPEVVERPDIKGVRWLSGPNKSHQVKIQNHKKSFIGSISYSFRPEKKGEYRVPSFEVKINGKVFKTEQFKFKVEESSPDKGGNARQWDELLYAEVEVAADKDTIYVGQEIPLTVTVYANDKLYIRQMSYPRIELGNVSFKDYSDVNKKNSKFSRPERGHETIDGETYSLIHFKTRVAPLKNGKFAGMAEVEVDLQIQKRTNESTEQWGRGGLLENFFRNSDFAKVRRTISGKIPDFNVKKLPSLPEDKGAFLGLVGDWGLDFVVEPDSVKVGKPLTVKLIITGDGNADTLNVPQLDLPGFRVFEPEVNRRSDGSEKKITISWVLIPLSLTADLTPQKFAVFDPERGSYMSESLMADISIKPSPDQSGGGEIYEADDDQGDASAESETGDEAENRTKLFPIKTQIGTYIKIPLWRNGVIPVILFSVSGVAIFVLLGVLRLKRDMLDSNPARRRRIKAVRQKNRIIKQLHQYKEDGEAAEIREIIVPYLCELLNLPPGTTSKNVGDELEQYDSELASAIRNIENNDFRAVKEEKIDISKLTRRLSQLVNRLSIFIVAFISLFAGTVYAQSEVTADGNDKSKFHNAVRAYESGRFEEAEKGFDELEIAGNMNAALLYNRGNCAFKQGDKVGALYYYEKARRLAPRDKEIRKNLNFTRESLGLSTLQIPEQPLPAVKYLRDRFRPDEWLKAAAFFLFTGTVSAGVFCWFRKNWLTVAIIGVLLAGAAGFAAYTQFNSSYCRHSHAIVASNQAQSHELPYPDSEKENLVLKKGQRVRLEQSRPEWYRVRKGKDVFWVSREYLRIVW